MNALHALETVAYVVVSVGFGFVVLYIAVQFVISIQFHRKVSGQPILFDCPVRASYWRGKSWSPESQWSRTQPTIRLTVRSGSVEINSRIPIAKLSDYITQINIAERAATMYRTSPTDAAMPAAIVIKSDSRRWWERKIRVAIDAGESRPEAWRALRAAGVVEDENGG